MANPSGRTLRLLSLLQAHRHWSGEELAQRLDVSVRTVRRDVDRLRELGYPVRAAPGVDGGYQLAPGAVLPPLLLDDEEAVAIAVGLELAAQASVAGIDESSVRALSKLSQVLPRHLAEQVEALRLATVSTTWASTSGAITTDVLIRLAQLVRDHERATFDYVAADGAESRREVEPMHLVRQGQRWYLVAYDSVRHDWRSFRLDRVSDAAGTGARFRPRVLPTGDVISFVRERMGRGPATYDVEAIVEAPASVVQQGIGRWMSVESIDASRCRVTVTSDTLEWQAFALAVTGAEFTVVGPPELRDLMSEWAQRFSRMQITTRPG